MYCALTYITWPPTHTQAEARMLTEQLESVKQELQSEKQKSVLFTAQCSPTSVSPSPHSERLVTLEMKELNERQRADLATTRYTTAHVLYVYMCMWVWIVYSVPVRQGCIHDFGSGGKIGNMKYLGERFSLALR